MKFMKSSSLKLLNPKSLRFLLLSGFILSVFFSCENDDPELVLPTVDNVEVGLNNNEIGVMGRDFHLNVEVLAGSKIDLVHVYIVPVDAETYEKFWSFGVTWDEYKGLKNATVHKHFDIPEDAVEGYYDFVIKVVDENGAILEEKRNITIYKAENLPVDPQIQEFSVSARGDSFRVLYIHSRGGYRDPITQEYGNYNVNIDKEETLSAVATISSLKDDGKIYILLINKKHNHRPESISSIDFTKAIVLDVFEHTNMEQKDRWTNFDYLRPNFPNISVLPIGASVDNNLPNPIDISGIKAWESGTYYVGFIYENTTHNMNLFHYIEVAIEGF
ncbi:hypothetical protein OB69_15695 [Roseivirga seohaensis subsp. aquiponti]|uniref:DUF4625 domain-containing protein n=1 Tax=Roseivirga seohaensis subsp. aquiponti TaxID=1566026 RepID=A0A0L8AHA2_9BACT|nr:DUF4625 domain-containing protein [Roseivirga seohaensis]KOF01784.1 hypothetical protein OB69_15695 [Roseivirga seohaensis subsp. aquiponti]